MTRSTSGCSLIQDRVVFACLERSSRSRARGRSDDQVVATSAPPEVAEAVRRKLRIAHGVLDILVAKVVLQGTSIMPIVGEFVAAGVPEHVRSNFQMPRSSRSRSRRRFLRGTERAGRMRLPVRHALPPPFCVAYEAPTGSR